MALWILLALIGVPIIEIALFIEIGGRIGLWPTIAVVIATAIIGTALLRQQGLNTLVRAQRELDAQRLPVRELFDGVCLLFAGALLLTPGFLTDTIGFALLVPPLRLLLGRGLWRLFQNARGVHIVVEGRRPGRRPRKPGDGPVIDADAVEIRTDDDDKPPKRK